MKLTAKTRAKIPTGKFALPGRRFPINDKAHARVAKSYASRMVKRGQLSPAEKSKIDAKANAMLGRKKLAYGGPSGFDLVDQSAARRASEFYSAPERQGLYNSPGGLKIGGGTLGVGNYGLPTKPAAPPKAVIGGARSGTPGPVASAGAGVGPALDTDSVTDMYNRFGPNRIGRAFGGRIPRPVEEFKVPPAPKPLPNFPLPDPLDPRKVKQMKTGGRMKLADGTTVGNSGRTKKGRMRLKYAQGGVAVAGTAYSGDGPQKRLKGNPSYNGLADYDGSGC